MDEFEKLLEAEHVSVEHFVRFRLNTKADADDVLQEVFLAVCQKFPQLKNNEVINRTFAAQLRDTHCRYLATPRNDGDIRNYITFLDGDGFILKPITAALFPSSFWTKTERRSCGADTIVMIGLSIAIGNPGVNSCMKMTELL